MSPGLLPQNIRLQVMSPLLESTRLSPGLSNVKDVRQRVLFVCIHNSARSQMAEAFLNQIGGKRFEARSAGLEPGRINPLVVEVMAEIGFDLSRKSTQRAADLAAAGTPFDYVVTVCDESSAERCPVFAGIAKRLHWSFRDPSAVTGTHGEKLEAVREIRDLIQARVQSWWDRVCPASAAAQ
jgi:arsenate reductase